MIFQSIHIMNHNAEFVLHSKTGTLNGIVGIIVDYKIAEPFWAALTAWICVYVLYIKNAFWKVPFLYSVAKNGFYLY